jgi:hypothetical protein
MFHLTLCSRIFQPTALLSVDILWVTDGKEKCNYAFLFVCVKVFCTFCGRLRESVVFGIAVFSFQISKSVHNPGFEPRTFGSVMPLLL